MPTSEPTTRFQVLTVCTGNVCRSPFAQRLLQATVARLGVPVDVMSAGTRALRGAPMDDQMTTVATKFGIVPAGHVARQLCPDLVANADLVLALSREHRREVVLMLPAKSRVAFTLEEFARLADDALARGLLQFDGANAAAEAVPRFVDIVMSRRGLAVLPDNPSDDDIPDPYGRGNSGYYNSCALTVSAVTRIEHALRAAVVGEVV